MPFTPHDVSFVHSAQHSSTDERGCWVRAVLAIVQQRADRRRKGHRAAVCICGTNFSPAQRAPVWLLTLTCRVMCTSL